MDASRPPLHEARRGVARGVQADIPGPGVRPAAPMRRGMICAAQPESTEAGALVMRAGGNAVDGAIACALTAGVVDPMMTGIAGFGSGQVYMPGRSVHACIDFHGKTPAGARPDMWADLL